MLTAVIESAVFAAAGYTGADALSLCAAVNLLTNISLNLILSLTGWGTAGVLILEMLIVAVEYLCYSCAFGKGRKLFALTFAANLLSFLIGKLIYG